MNVNLKVDTYTDMQLQEKFKLPNCYTPSDVSHTIDRLVSIANNSLGKNDKDDFMIFLESAKKRLMESSDSGTANYEYLNELLPTDREMTLIPEMHSIPPQIALHTKDNYYSATPMSSAPVSQAPVSQEPVSQEPVSQAPVSQEPVSQAPVSQAPVSQAPSWSKLNLNNNVTKRLIKVDSQYRPNISTIDTEGQPSVDGPPSISVSSFNTNFTVNLSEPLDNVVSMKLYSVHIPTTWYTFDAHLGNTLFSSGGDDCKSIPYGNYDAYTLIEKLNEIVSDISFSIDTPTNKIKLTSAAATTFQYYNVNGLRDSENNFGGNYVDQNLGWTIGFRRTPDSSNNITIDVSGEVLGDVPINVYGPKYFVLCIDDFNQHQHIKGFTNVTDGNAQILTRRPSRLTSNNKANLTQNQIYANNAILNKPSDPNSRIVGPRSTDAFAMIPLKSVSTIRPEPLVDYGLSLQCNLRTYSGPVNIERLKIRLMDDKGNLVNLHDNDWSFSFVVEQMF